MREKNHLGIIDLLNFRYNDSHLDGLRPRTALSWSLRGRCCARFIMRMINLPTNPFGTCIVRICRYSSSISIGKFMIRILISTILVAAAVCSTAAQADFTPHVQKAFTEACRVDYQRRLAPKMVKHSKLYVDEYGRLACYCLRRTLEMQDEQSRQRDGGLVFTESDWTLLIDLVKKGSWNSDHPKGSTPKVTEALPLMAGLLYAGLAVDPGKACVESGLQKLPKE